LLTSQTIDSRALLDSKDLFSVADQRALRHLLLK
jgi:hypothetical protein